MQRHSAGGKRVAGRPILHATVTVTVTFSSLVFKSHAHSLVCSSLFSLLCRRHSASACPTRQSGTKCLARKPAPAARASPRTTPAFTVQLDTRPILRPAMASTLALLALLLASCAALLPSGVDAAERSVPPYERGKDKYQWITTEVSD